LDPVLFDIFFNASGIEYTFRKLGDHTKLSGASDSPSGWNAIQRELDKLKKWAHVNLMKFNNAKCKVLHMGRGKAQYQYTLGHEGIENSPEEDLGYWWVKIWT